MSEENKLSDDFMVALAQYHNPETIFKMAKTDWEKAVAIEFFLVKKKYDAIVKEIEWLKWLIKSVFGIGIIGILIQTIPKFFGM